MSSDLIFGLKLANGDTGNPGFDADTQIGGGSTDQLLGGYHLGRLSADNGWTYFLQGQLDVPISHKLNHRPGAEGVAAAGVYFEGWSTHRALKFSPVGPLRVVYRRPDCGVDGLPQERGYSRVLVSPGVEVAKGKVRVYADLAVPVYTNAPCQRLLRAHRNWRPDTPRPPSWPGPSPVTPST